MNEEQMLHIKDKIKTLTEGIAATKSLHTDLWKYELDLSAMKVFLNIIETKVFKNE